MEDAKTVDALMVRRYRYDSLLFYVIYWISSLEYLRFIRAYVYRFFRPFVLFVTNISIKYITFDVHVPILFIVQSNNVRHTLLARMIERLEDA